MTDVIEHGAAITLNPSWSCLRLAMVTPKLTSLARWLARSPDEADDLE